jgi:hypothetical protein
VDPASRDQGIVDPASRDQAAAGWIAMDWVEQGIVDPASRDQAAAGWIAMGWVDQGIVDPASRDQAAVGWIVQATIVVASNRGCWMVGLLVAEGAYFWVQMCVPSCKNNH